MRSLNETLIPAIPFCHSGISPKDLPAPLNNLNAILASNEDQLKQAFHSLQTAFGVKGKLKTNFSTLSENIKEIEHKNLECSLLVSLISSFVGNKFYKLLPEWEKLDKGSIVEFNKSGVGNSLVGEISILRLQGLEVEYDIDVTTMRDVSDTDGNSNCADVCVKIPVDILISNKEKLLSYNF